MNSISVHKTFGALLAGGIVAAVFSGIVISHCFAYYKFYSKDRLAIRTLVAVVGLLDLSHTICVSISLWSDLIDHFGDAHRIDFVPWSLALTIAITAVLTFMVHLFFIHRIYKLSKGMWYLALPLVLLTCARLCFASLTTAKLISLRSLTTFVRLYTFSFTAGLALSVGIDVLITCAMYILLSRSRKQNSSLNPILDALILYTFENGSLTAVAALASLLCWLTNKTNLAFMAIHFVISKFYAISLLATLNSRKNLHPAGHRSQHSNSGPERNMPIIFPDHFALPGKGFRATESNIRLNGSSQVQVSVNRDVTVVTDAGSSSDTSDPMDLKMESEVRY